ncbi:hypothetical protein [Advenella mimigardefordensis]|uniref:Regulatory protein, RpfE type n=1 Tax=Advenella mimigardefordensis (strain DSM 17166 / LMG 22922 / DPN7) TaxID=1247726 RepID=W0PF77_ADVMD|nr:hypothetical protein [Advenella mimigardefordensis]AHG63950.1 hypothetical protein MIM_c18700 [Advenella mimigardefordensis DPN7]
MQLIISGALPPQSLADETAIHLEKTATLLRRLFEYATPHNHPADQDLTGCTPYEAWLVQRYQFAPVADQAPCAALAPILVPDAPAAAPVWLFQLAHFGLSNSGAHMLTASDIAVTEKESQALYESAAEIFTDTPFTLIGNRPEGWLVAVPAGFSLPSRSPALIASADLAHVWPQEEDYKPLRRLLSELQIAWHHHPVNEARRDRQMPLINGGWLFGGATPAQLSAPATPMPIVIRDLEAAHRQRQWGQWLALLPAVEQKIAGELATALNPQASGNPVTLPVNLILTGDNRWVSLTLEPTPALLKWLPGKRKQWKQWWSQ